MLTPALRSEVGRILRFAAVGLAATAVHLSVALVLAGLFGVPAQAANLAAFVAAFWVSYIGHYHFSFQSSARHTRAFWRFLGVALAGFAAGALALEATAHLTDWGDLARLTISAMLVPAVSYIVNRLFVF
ncbi:MAG: GtrA family protein [Pseudomonadota bacterium]